jgi:hypothetical protein
MNLTRKNLVPIPSDRRFGWLFTSIFSLGFLYFYHAQSLWLAVTSATLAVVFLLLTIFLPLLLAPLNKAWFALGLILGRVVSPLVLSIIFFSLIAPVAIFTRLFGRDALFLKKRQVSTYWVKKESIDPDSFKNQF